MYFNEYQQLAERTARKANDTPEKRFINFSFGLTGETGEVIDCLKNTFFTGTRYPEGFSEERSIHREDNT